MHWLGPYEGFAGGGALFFYSSNTITVSSCSIEGNSNTGGFGMGGAMLFVSSNTITVSSCSIEGNSNTGGYGVGGAMYFRSSNPITLTSCSIESNSNIGGYGYGGALVFLQASNTITLINCSIEGNSITGGKGMGGAIYFSAANQISIALCTFANNIAGEGGAIYLDVTSTFIGMTSVFFSRNIALSGAGGAVYVGASSSYISFGGPMPIFETCNGVCDQTINIDANNKGHSNTVVQEPTNLHVVGYYVVFNDVGGSMSSSSYGSCGSIVGDYSLTCASNDVRPGVNGKAPYLYHGSIILTYSILL